MIAITEVQIETLREAGKRMARVVREILPKVAAGTNSWELEERAREITAALGATPSFLGYKNKGEQAYPTALCVSVNHEIAHSPASKEKVFKDGDVVSIDFGLCYKRVYMDTAHTVGVGRVDAKAQNLLAGTKEALDVALATIKAGVRTGDIGAVIEAVAKKYKLGVVKDLRGHGVGAAVHELPNIPNFGKAGEGEELPLGCVVAIEPIFAEGSGVMVVDKDGFTYKTRDQSRAAHFEHTVLITKEGVEILTAL